MSNPNATTRWRCLFFGMPCAFSSPILAALARPGVELVGVVTPQTSPDSQPYRLIRGLRSRPTITLSGETSHFEATRYLVRDIANSHLHTELAELEPDLIIVACYPRLIPAQIRNAAKIAALNIHPSLLPRHRGPDPLFWTFHAGDDAAGITIHHLSDLFDAGDILLQESTGIRADESLPVLEQRLARLAANHVSSLITGLPSLPRSRPQDIALVVSESWPTEQDRTITASWSVTRARRFIAGVAHSHGPILWQDGGGSWHVTGLAEPGSGREITLANGTLNVALRSLGDADRASRF
jgi:methionyl-tRNA formyltransferase